MDALLENWLKFVSESSKRTGTLNSDYVGYVEVRSPYSKDQKVAHVGSPGDQVEILGSWSDKGMRWLEVDVGGTKGWIGASELTMDEDVIEEKDDACTRKVKSRYKVWPSAYASGALVKCRKVGAANWGNKSKKESVEHLEEKSDFSKEEKEGLHGWFSRQGAKGKVGGWIDCNTGKPCGRQKGEKRAKPRCRPTKAQCKGYKRPDERNENMRMSKNLLEGIIFEEVRRFMFETNVLPHLDEAFLEDGTPVCVGCLAEQLDAASCDCPDLVYEAEYQGRKVTLNKPTRGDVKKFKVYVKDPSTGNIKKVNFGHGGSSAKAKGEKTMKIRKSNPKARKNFRARHNCDNPGPKTKARYWSCKKW